TMLRGLASERAQMRERAYTRVAEGWGGASVFGGPILIIPTERRVLKGGTTYTVRSELYLLPSRLQADVQVKLEPEPMKVGIYGVPVCSGGVRTEGEFDRGALAAMLGEPTTTYLWEQARLLLPMSQVRSLRRVRFAEFGSAALA